MNTNSIWLVFNISENINDAKIVAVNGCINNPMEPLDADIFAIPYVIKNCPPNWHKKASKNNSSIQNLLLEICYQIQEALV